MKRILFVDEDQSALQSTRRMLRSVCREWEVHLADNAQAAFEVLETEGAFDLVVSEARLPGMDGVAFLGIVRDQYPQTARFALSGRSDGETLLKIATVSHQFITKPCDPRHLANLVARTLAIRDHLHSPAMRETLMSIGSLPSVPALYTAIMEEIQSDDPSVHKVGEIISRDVAMSAKVLQIVNSAYLGLSHDVRDPIHAATLLGLEHLKNIALAVGLFSTSGGDPLSKEFNMDRLWQHSLRVADFSKRIAESEVRDRKIADHSFTAGLLHDVGLIVLAMKKTKILDDALRRAKAEDISIFEVERQMLGVTHAQIGACLLELWGISSTVVEAIAYHDLPSARPQDDFLPDSGDQLGDNAGVPAASAPPFTPLTAVHVANCFCEQERIAAEACNGGLDGAYLEAQGGAGQLGHWWELCFRAER